MCILPFEKQTKLIEEQGQKQIDAITNQNKRLEALTNNDDHNSIYKEIFNKLVKEKFDGIKELTYKIDHNDLIYYFKNDTVKKKFNDFDNDIQLFKKIQSGEMKLEGTKEMQNIFKLNLNEILKETVKSKKQKSASENTKLLYKSRQPVIKLFNGYYSIVSEAKHKVKYREEFKILIPKQMLQRLLIPMVRVKEGSTPENLQKKSEKLYILGIEQKTLLKKQTTI